MYLVDKMQYLQELMAKNGWVSGKEARGYSFAASGPTKTGRNHMEEEHIEDSEHLLIMNKAALDARSALMSIANVQRKLPDVGRCWQYLEACGASSCVSLQLSLQCGSQNNEVFD